MNWILAKLSIAASIVLAMACASILHAFVIAIGQEIIATSPNSLFQIGRILALKIVMSLDVA